MPAAAGAALVLEAAPANQGWLALLEDPLREGHAAQALGAAAPLVAGEGIDVGRLRRFGDGKAAHGLGRIHQQPGLLGMLLELMGDRRDRHHRPGVPEQVGEDHEPGPGGLAGLELLQHGGLQFRLRRGLAEREDRQGGQAQLVAASQFLAGGDDTGVLAVADQQLIACLPGQAPEG